MRWMSTGVRFGVARSASAASAGIARERRAVTALREMGTRLRVGGGGAIDHPARATVRRRRKSIDRRRR
jgi:hypothetical protein